MLSFVYILFGSIIAFLGYRFWKKQRYNALARQHGCEPATQFAHKDPIFGIDAFIESGKMFNEHKLFPMNFERTRKYGKTYELQIFGQSVFCSSEPENIQFVFGTNAKNWGVFYRLPALIEYCGRGFLTVDGPEWERSRQLFSHSFARANIIDHTNYEHYVSLLIKNIPEDGSTVDLQPLIFSLYLDTATLFLFGESFDSLSKGLVGEAEGFIESFAYSLGASGVKQAMGPLSFLHRDPKFHESNLKNHGFVEKYIDRALDLKAKGQLASGGSGKRKVLLDLMAEQMDDRTQLRNEATHAFIAAHETTSCLISNIVWVLARHPEVWAKLREEVLALGDAQLTFDSAVRLKYLQNVIHETLRLYPVFPFHIRESYTPSILPTGGGPSGKSPIFVPAHSRFDANFAVLHRHRDIWGADADEFRPERWETFRPKAWEFMAFGGGPRACVGRQKALMETAYLVARLAGEFEGVESRDGRGWVGRVQITAKNLHGCWVGMRRAAG